MVFFLQFQDDIILSLSCDDGLHFVFLKRLVDVRTATYSSSSSSCSFACLLPDESIAGPFVAPRPPKMKRELCFEGVPDDRQALGRRHGRTSQVLSAVKLWRHAHTHARTRDGVGVLKMGCQGRTRMEIIVWKQAKQKMLSKVCGYWSYVLWVRYANHVKTGMRLSMENCDTIGTWIVILMFSARYQLPLLLWTGI